MIFYIPFITEGTQGSDPQQALTFGGLFMFRKVAGWLD